ALDFYNTTIADLLNTNRGLVSGIADPQLAQRAGAFVAMSRIKELAALEREQVSGVLDRGRFAPGEFRRFTSTLATRAVLLSEFRAGADDAQRVLFVDTLVGPEAQRARELQAAVTAGQAAPGGGPGGPGRGPARGRPRRMVDGQRDRDRPAAPRRGGPGRGRGR